MLFPPQMKVKWKQMLLQVLRERKKSEMESLTSRKQSKERGRDSALYLKLSGYVSLAVWKLQLRTFCQAQNCLKFFAGTKEYV